ncbi:MULTISPECIES: hypothetical protein [Bacillus cereus group]|uniref:hypothetical protein n=1 Tax=Bacillus cereus group TaxID=86661 RepID=UPI00077288DD|nr:MULTISPECIES: hypothetical protein [Bacillus cereus group]ARZ61496.1 hypothetical protein B7P25_06615 [Bacillus thuringiensis]KXI47425.1 hypothetical protein ACS95_18345 [Bacillus cereus]MED1444146.1 hypothetical protein [Bacillus pacificus]
MIKEKITKIKTYLKALPKNQQVAEDLDFYTFLATLIPVPGYQQAALLVNKLVANHNLNLLITELREGIYQTNTRISTIESDVEKIQSMANIVSVVSALDDKINLIMEQAQQEFPTEFIVETADWSTQTIINQIINADFTSVSANNNSHNRLENVDINSKRTHLRATNHSSNYLQGTKFNDSSGTVGMNGITQQGDIQVTGNSVGFGNGGTLIFGNPNEVKAKCTTCNKMIVADRIELQRYSHIECPHCKSIFRIIL